MSDPQERAERQFFVSFNKADRDWAEWIAWVVSGAGYTVYYQHWDMIPGANWVAEMQRAITQTERTLLVLSDDALQSDFVTAEWGAAFSADPVGEQRRLVPVRIRPVTLPRGLLGQIVYVDLVGLSRGDARSALLGALQKLRDPSAARPRAEPGFPGRPTTTDERPQPEGTEETEPPLSRRDLAAALHDLSSTRFNILLERLDLPAGLVPPMPVPQERRALPLLAWTEGPSGDPDRVRRCLREARAAEKIPLDQIPPDPLVERTIANCDDLEELDRLGTGYIALEQWPSAYLAYRELLAAAATESTRSYAHALKMLAEVHQKYGEVENAEHRRGQYRRIAALVD